MSLVTGSAQGLVTNQESLYIQGAPNIYFQDYNADPLNNPDGDGYYWGMSGTATYPVFGLDCITDVSLTQNVTMNDIRCDTVGVKGTIQQRDSVDLKFSSQTFFPLSILSKLMNFSTATVGTGTEKVGIGEIDNNKFYMAYAPKVYDNESGDYLLIHLHKCSFVDVGDVQFRYGENWISSFTLRAYADDTKPATMLFGTILRSDASALP